MKYVVRTIDTIVLERITGIGAKRAAYRTMLGLCGEQSGADRILEINAQDVAMLSQDGIRVLCANPGWVIPR